MNWNNHYVIDWDKVKTLGDMKRIIAAIGITFELGDPSLENIKDLVREELKGSSIAVMD